MSYYEMEVQGVIATIEAINAANNNIEARLDAAEAEAQKLINDGWHGNDRAAYDQAKRQWDQDCLDMNEILRNQAAPTLNQMVENVLSTEQINSKIW
jgi:uncharacterized protein YukE